MGAADITVRNNTVTSGGTDNYAGVHLFAGNGSVGEANVLEVRFSNNTVDANLAASGFADYVLAQYTGNVFQIQGLVLASGATQAQVESFVASTDLYARPTPPYRQLRGRKPVAALMLRGGSQPSLTRIASLLE